MKEFLEIMRDTYGTAGVSGWEWLVIAIGVSLVVWLHREELGLTKEGEE